VLVDLVCVEITGPFVLRLVLTSRLLSFFALRVHDVTLVLVYTLLALFVAHVDFGVLSILARGLPCLHLSPLLLDFRVSSLLSCVFGAPTKV